MELAYDSVLKIAAASKIENPNNLSAGDRVCVDKKFIDSQNLGKSSRPVKNKKETFIPPKVEPVPSPITYAPVVEEKKTETPKEEHKKTEPESEPEVLIGAAAVPYLSYSRIDAVQTSNNAKGSVLSRADYGIDLKVMQLWGNYLISEMFLQAEKRTYVTNSGRTFNQHGGSMLNFGAGMGYKLWNRLELKTKIFYGDEFYFRAPDTRSLAIDGTKTLKIDFIFNLDVMNGKYASTGIGLGSRIIKSSYIDPIGAEVYSAKTGYGYFMTFYMKHRFGRLMFEESFTYENMTKNTDIANQVHSAAYIKSGVVVLF